MSKNIIRPADECQKILSDMALYAEAARQDYTESHADTGPCGFAEVVIDKREVSLRRSEGSPFPRRLSYKGQSPSTLAFCGSYQSIDAVETVARAMADSLIRNGVQAHIRSWMD